MGILPVCVLFSELPTEARREVRPYGSRIADLSAAM